MQKSCSLNFRFPHCRIPDMVRQKFANSHKDPLNKLETKISQDATVSKALQMMEAAANSSAGGTPARTMASPQWGSDSPVNFRKLLNLASISVSEFDTNNTYLPFAYLKVFRFLRFCVFKVVLFQVHHFYLSGQKHVRPSHGSRIFSWF